MNVMEKEKYVLEKDKDKEKSEWYNRNKSLKPNDMRVISDEVD